MQVILELGSAQTFNSRDNIELESLTVKFIDEAVSGSVADVSRKFSPRKSFIFSGSHNLIPRSNELRVFRNTKG